MHDVERRTGNLGDLDAAIRGLGLHLLGPRNRVVVGRRLAPPEMVLDDLINHDAVLAMHHDHRPNATSVLHGSENFAVGRIEHTGICSEEFERRNSLAVHHVHFLQRLLVHVRHDHVKAVVDGAVAVGLRMPLVERSSERATLLLDGEINNRRRATPSRRTRAGLEGVGGHRAAKRHFHVGVNVDAARDHVLCCCINDPSAAGQGGDIVRRARLEQCGDAFAVYHHGHRMGAGRGDDGAVGDHGTRHGHSPGAGSSLTGLGRP